MRHRAKIRIYLKLEILVFSVSRQNNALGLDVVGRRIFETHNQTHVKC